MTGLRLPKRSKPNYYPDTPDYTDGQGRKYWIRVVLISDEEIGEVPVPEGNWRAVMEWDAVTGLPRVTSDKEWDMRYDNHTTHFYFNPNPSMNTRTWDKDDIAISRRRSWRHEGHGNCLDVDAYGIRSGHYSNVCFRPVHGLLVLPKSEEIPI